MTSEDPVQPDEEDKDQEVRAADRDARKYQVIAWFWRVLTAAVIVAYVFDALSEKFIFVILTYMSGDALAATYEAKKEGAKARKAGYQNP